MYGLSVETDLTPLLNTTLTFIGFGEHQLQLGFSGPPDCGISIEGGYSFKSASEAATHYNTATAGASQLLPLLGRTVKGAGVLRDGVVQLNLDGDVTIEILDDQKQYESYQINLGADASLIVV